MIYQSIKYLIAVIMLFPIKEGSEAHREEEKTRIEEEGQEVRFVMTTYVDHFLLLLCVICSLKFIIKS